MKRARGISAKQKQAIKTYVSKGYSANKIQQRLRARHIGLRRQVILRRVRIYRRQVPKPHVEKYYPRMRMEQKQAGKIGFLQKQLAVYGTRHGEHRRIQMVGSGYQLYRAMMLVSRHPPKKQFLTISTEALLEDPHRYLEGGNWDAHPEASS